jgi:hypothetical protein
MVVSGSSNNLSTLTVDGLLTAIYTDSTLIGAGTNNNPLRVVGGSGGGTATGTSVVGGQGTTVTTVNGAAAVNIAKSSLNAGTYNGITFNSLGIATAFNPDGDDSIVSVLGGNDIQASVTSNIATVSLSSTSASSSTYLLGGYSVTTTSGGRIDKAERTVNLGAGQGVNLKMIDPEDGIVKTLTFNNSGTLVGLTAESATSSGTIIRSFFNSYGQFN